MPTSSLSRAPLFSLCVLSLALLLSPVFSSPGPAVGAPCSQARNQLITGTNQFKSECGYTKFCSAQGTCQPKGCRRDEYPLGYGRTAQLPPLCGPGQFCPDEEDACQDVLPVGSPCQLNRDDECAPPDSSQPPGTTSICLHFACQWKNATLNSPCLNENIVYTVYGSGGQNYGDVVSRDNCGSLLYCDAPSSTCHAQKDQGQPCAADKECQSYNCASSSSQPGQYNNIQNGVCGPPLGQDRGGKLYSFVILGVGALAETHAYYAEQIKLRDQVRLYGVGAVMASAKDAAKVGYDGSGRVAGGERKPGWMRPRPREKVVGEWSGGNGSAIEMDDRAFRRNYAGESAEDVTVEAMSASAQPFIGRVEQRR